MLITIHGVCVCVFNGTYICIYIYYILIPCIYIYFMYIHIYMEYIHMCVCIVLFIVHISYTFLVVNWGQKRESNWVKVIIKLENAHARCDKSSYSSRVFKLLPSQFLPGEQCLRKSVKIRWGIRTLLRVGPKTETIKAEPTHISTGIVHNMVESFW